MAWETEMPESMDTGGSFYKPTKKETLHLAVLAVDENPTSKNDGTLMNGTNISVEIMAGEHAKQQCDLMLWNEKPTDKNNGELAKRRKGRFVDSMSLLPKDVSPGQKVQINIQQAVGRQFIATVEPDEKTGYPKFAFADIWHVDDPAAPNCERNQDALKLLPKALRRDPASFKQNGGSTTAAKSPTPPPAAAAASTGDPIDEI
jgi:hypothetical protein